MANRLTISCWNEEEKYNRLFYYTGGSLLDITFEKTSWKNLEAFKNIKVLNVDRTVMELPKGINGRGVESIVERLWDEEFIRTQTTLF